VNDDIEIRLDEYLRPVTPGKDFIDKLRNRLFDEPTISIEYPEYIYLVLFICLSFTFGIGLIWILSRLIRQSRK